MEKFVIITHNGTFHSDDVFACATLSLAFPEKELEIIRSRDEADFAVADAVVDVGGTYDPAKLRFDHHQLGGAGTRENGIPYASFGLVWKEYGARISGSEENSKIIDEQLVQCIDGPDNGVTEKVASNGVYPYTVVDMISAYRPTWEEGRAMDEAFLDAVNAGIGILQRMISHTQSYAHALGILEAAYQAAPDKRIIDIGKEYPGLYEVMTRHPEPLYALYEREDGNWSVKAVKVEPLRFELRKPLPAAWAGLRAEELQEMTGVSDAIFCHRNCFLCAAGSREGALKLAQMALAA